MMPIRNFMIAVVASAAMHAAVAIAFHPNGGNATDGTEALPVVINLGLVPDMEVIANWQMAPHMVIDANRSHISTVYPEPITPPSPPTLRQIPHVLLPYTMAPDSEIVLPLALPEPVTREVPSPDQPSDVVAEFPEARVVSTHADEAAQVIQAPTPRPPHPPDIEARPADRKNSSTTEVPPTDPISTRSPPMPAVSEAPEQARTGEVVGDAEAVGHADAQELSLLQQYGNSIRAAIRQQLRFPRHARAVGLEGTTTLAVAITRNGRLVENSIRVGSGHPVLDQVAYTSANKGEYPPAPSALVGERFEFRIPITFQLP